MALSGHMIRTLDRGLAIRIGLGVGGAYVAGSLSVLGFLAFAHSGSFSPEATWMPLLATILIRGRQWRRPRSGLTRRAGVITRGYRFGWTLRVRRRLLVE